MVNVVQKDWLFCVIDRHSDGTYKKRIKFSKNDIEKILWLFTFDQLDWLRESIQWECNEIDYITDEDNEQKPKINNEAEEESIENNYVVFDIWKYKKTIIYWILIIVSIILLIFVILWKKTDIWFKNNTNLWNQEIYNKINTLELSKIEADNKYQKEILIINNQILILKDQLNINNSKYLIDKKWNEIIQKIDGKFTK